MKFSAVTSTLFPDLTGTGRTFMSNFKQHMLNFATARGLDGNNPFARIAEIDGEKGAEILREAIAMSCQATHMGSMEAGWAALAEMPPSWLRDRLVKESLTVVHLDDDMEYRQLCELSLRTLPEKLEDIVTLGLKSLNADIREAAEDYRHEIIRNDQNANQL